MDPEGRVLYVPLLPGRTVSLSLAQDTPWVQVSLHLYSGHSRPVLVSIGSLNFAFMRAPLQCSLRLRMTSGDILHVYSCGEATLRLSTNYQALYELSLSIPPAPFRNLIAKDRSMTSESLRPVYKKPDRPVLEPCEQEPMGAPPLRPVSMVSVPSSKLDPTIGKRYDLTPAASTSSLAPLSNPVKSLHVHEPDPLPSIKMNKAKPSGRPRLNNDN